MEDQSKEIQPPSYIATIRECDEMVALVNMVLESVADSSFNDADAFSTERLRRFLWFLMARDYCIGHYWVRHSRDFQGYSDANTTPWLFAEDTDYFNKVFVYIDQTLMRQRRCGLDNCDKTAAGAYLWKHIHAPARALGLPMEAVVLRIRHFALFKTQYNLGVCKYDGCIRKTYYTYDFMELARKFLLDRGTIVPRVAPNPVAGRVMIGKIREFVEYYFNRLDGFDYNLTLDLDNTSHKVSSYHEEPITFELGNGGKRYQMHEKSWDRESRKAIAHLYDIARPGVLRRMTKHGLEASKGVLERVLFGNSQRKYTR
ncbi:uncharacterized protein K452DRAFT_317740 [Aplosporella prunicola CBS 121167]|uniref:Uncharacterized protein n=1 Tax=Aplosporella prunicola CBS 121167 TaxID=1176127 RepID=A0A6A6BHV2_9PEZI|nr:uncharacterized protein K452DRAFT_317740 [Aplosporella prunicola CBS 121167]KAF2142834.1 hypothetical protein K452DRAFT_317740 [Aplosporella prunicola CBS 121167]